MICKWNQYRHKIGSFPPPGWPLHIILTIIAIIVTIIIILHGYKNIIQYIKEKRKKVNIKKTVKCLQTDDKEKVECLQTDDNIKPVENISFDTDSDRFVVDNSANCIIWKNKTDFVPTTYIKTNNASVGITTAVGTALPLGIG